MVETVLLTFSGNLLALLMYENVKSPHEQEGFLFGDTHTVVTKTITDHDSQNVNRQKVIRINAIMPCPRTNLFYNSVGHVSKQKLIEILGDELKNVIGWYRFEPTHTPKLTIRSKIVHKQLGQIFPIEPDLFSYCLLTSNSTQSESTHTYTHSFHRYVHKRFEILPFHIENLGELNSDYKPNDSTSKTFSNMYKSLGFDKFKSTDWKMIDQMQDQLKLKTELIAKHLLHSERLCEEKERSILLLRKQIMRRKLEIDDNSYGNGNGFRDEVGIDSDSESNYKVVENTSNNSMNSMLKEDEENDSPNTIFTTSPLPQRITYARMASKTFRNVS